MYASTRSSSGLGNIPKGQWQPAYPQGDGQWAQDGITPDQLEVGSRDWWDWVSRRNYGAGGWPTETEVPGNIVPWYEAAGIPLITEASGAVSVPHPAYFEVFGAEWERLRQAGFNCVDAPLFWHPGAGVWANNFEMKARSWAVGEFAQVYPGIMSEQTRIENEQLGAPPIENGVCGYILEAPYLAPQDPENEAYVPEDEVPDPWVPPDPPTLEEHPGCVQGWAPGFTPGPEYAPYCCIVDGAGQQVCQPAPGGDVPPGSLVPRIPSEYGPYGPTAEEEEYWRQQDAAEEPSAGGESLPDGGYVPPNLPTGEKNPDYHPTRHTPVGTPYTDPHIPPPPPWETGGGAGGAGGSGGGGAGVPVGAGAATGVGGLPLWLLAAGAFLLLRRKR